MIRSVLLILLCTVALIQAATPPGWIAQTLGSPSQAGSVNYIEATGRTEISGPHHNIDGSTDRFQFVYQALTGDGEIVARVTSQTNPASYPHAGVMFRTSLAANSANIEIFATRHLGLVLQRRATDGATTQGDSTNGSLSAPVWIKLSRLGQRVTAFSSLDGKLWKSLGSFSGVAFPNTIYAGLSAGSNAYNGGAVSTYEHIAVRSAGAPPTDGVVSVLGRAAAVGSVVESVPGAVTLSGNGLNIGGQAPDFLFLQKPFSQDGEIKVRISDLSALGGNTNAGIMIRDSLQPGAVYFSIALSSNGLTRQHINSVGSNPTILYGSSGPLPGWLRLVRHGPLFSAFSSSDGVAWSPLGGPVALPMGTNTLAGLTLVAGGGDTAFAQAAFDQIVWPSATTPGPELDPVIAAGLTAWRKPDVNGIRCVDCHTPFGYDIAQFNFNRADVRLATTPHLPQADADAIFDMIEKLRVQYPPAGGLKDFRTFRPLQPGGGHVVGGENATPDERDSAFGFSLRDRFRLAQERITKLPEARSAAQELIDVNTAIVPVGIKFNLWSRSVLREGAVTGGEIAEWLPAAGLQPKPEFAEYWFALQDAYLRDPSNKNFWAIYHAVPFWTQLDPHNFIPGSTHGNWRYVIDSQYLANSLFAHDELLKARGLPSQLDAEDGVRPFPSQRGTGPVELAPFWNVGDNARVVQNQGFAGFPRRNKESAHVDLSYNGNLAEVSGWQVNDFRLTWFWIGWNMDNSLRFSGEGSTLSGEYFIGSLWQGDVDNARTGDSDASHGYRMHQVFFNAVQQFKLGYKPGAWRDNDGVQHFEASKGYYLGYNRWRPRNETREIGLPGGNALYKRIISNHLRTAILIHADEARKAAGVYFGEQFTLYDLSLWRDVLQWADPEWAEADEASLAELKASLFPPLTITEMGDPDGDGQSTFLETALGTIPDAGNSPATASQVERGVDGRLKVTFTRVREDFTYVVEGTSDLDDWTVIATNPGTVGESVTVVDTDTSGPTSRYLRLRIIKARL